jgi:hypothetical protein
VTKTAQAERRVVLTLGTVRIPRTIQPLRIAPDVHVFVNTEARPIEPKRFDHWYACLRALGIRVRGPYSTKNTYVSHALTAGISPALLEEQTGVRYETLKKHYGKWLRTEGVAQLRTLAALAPDNCEPPQVLEIEVN